MPDEDEVLAQGAGAIGQLRSMGVPYADLFSPLHDDALAGALRRLTVRTHGASLGARDVEMVAPPIYGRYLLVYSTDVGVDQRRFALRHGMGHVAAGHVGATTLLTARADSAEPAERVADLFALADLVPFWELADLRRARASWATLRSHVARSIAHYTVGWPPDRISDRATTRVALYRARGV
jgi:hypothetical protein